MRAVWENSFLSAGELATPSALFPPPTASGWFGGPPAAPCGFPDAGAAAAASDVSSLTGMLPPPQFWSQVCLSSHDNCARLRS